MAFQVTFILFAVLDSFWGWGTVFIYCSTRVAPVKNHCAAILPLQYPEFLRYIHGATTGYQLIVLLPSLALSSEHSSPPGGAACTVRSPCKGGPQHVVMKTATGVSLSHQCSFVYSGHGSYPVNQISYLRWSDVLIIGEWPLEYTSAL